MTVGAAGVSYFARRTKQAAGRTLRKAKRKAKRYTMKTTVRRTKTAPTDLTSLRRVYNQNSIKMCYAQSTKMVNDIPTVALTDTTIKDHLNHFTSYLCSNNGIADPSAATYPQSPFTKDQQCHYTQIDYFKNLGKAYFDIKSTTPRVKLGIEYPDIEMNNHLYRMRTQWRKWKRDNIEFVIRFRRKSQLGAVGKLPILKGYYRCFKGKTVKRGMVQVITGDLITFRQWTNDEDPAIIHHYDTIRLSPSQQIQDEIGTPNAFTTSPGTGYSIGAFPNDFSAENTDKMSWDTVRESKQWKSFTTAKTLRISHKGGKYQPTSSNVVGDNPIIILVIHSINGYKASKFNMADVKQATGGNPNSFTCDIVEVPNDTIEPKIIADIEILSCYSFSGRTEFGNNDPVPLTTSYIDVHPLCHTYNGVGSEAIDFTDPDDYQTEPN
jgi:hypothetical protein